MRHTKTMTRRFTGAAALALAAILTACESDEPTMAPPPIGSTPTPTPTPTPTTGTLDVSRCLSQVVFADGTTVQNLVIPDVLTIDPALPAGFPNGRKLADPVIDVTLAAIFLDIDAPGQSAATLAQIPLNPSANDVALPSGFPFLAPPQGSPPIAATTGTQFNFRTDADSAYERVDRMGFPAVSTALVPSGSKLAYNDGGPVQDASGQYAAGIVATLTALTEALRDDLTGAGLNICAD
ncbi:DUF4331 domain-containing protein [Erythrobacter sp. SDW2]|uniref:DUF4331 domain-containing protein n=1 Tax=Erythrobacter sp. SDW2 TaxID=2907154 RepID=UPI001F1CC2A4|nr:DUF4331 domain-containing protein [Erythrobacter sp. SDW2]UIP07788.1 DUF4331 domain-containing protein [Erythrobacter sp. SDW2]